MEKTFFSRAPEAYEGGPQIIDVDDTASVMLDVREPESGEYKVAVVTIREAKNGMRKDHPWVLEVEGYAMPQALVHINKNGQEGFVVPIGNSLTFYPHIPPTETAETD